MHCLIIAAGHGSRLGGISSSKPLTPVAGVPLIEHVIRAAAAGGPAARRGLPRSSRRLWTKASARGARPASAPSIDPRLAGLAPLAASPLVVSADIQ